MRPNRKLPTRRNQGPDARNGAPSRQQSALLKKFRELAAYCNMVNALVILDPDGEAIPIGPVCPNRPILDAFHYPPRDGDAKVRELNKQYHDVLKQLEAEKKRLAELEERYREWKRQNGVEESWIDKPVDEMTKEELAILIPKLQALSNHLKQKLQEHDEKEATRTLPAAEEAGTSSSAMVAG